MWGVGDPVGLGLVASLARPGGNVTGVSFSVGMDIVGKGLELLREAIPKVRRVAVLSNPGNPAHALAIDNLKVVARSLGVHLQLLEARGPSEFDGAFAAMARERAIVMIFVAEPVGLGLVMSLARPGGNITGTTLWGGWEIFRKQLQLLREVAPRIGRVAVLWNSANRPAHHLVLRSVETAARSMDVELQPEGAQGPEEFDRAFAAMRQGHAGALLVISDLAYLPHRARIAELAIKSRLPTMFAFRWDVEAGGLMSYGPDQAEMVRRAATYVDKLLRGVKPADLPVEEPTKFNLAINIKTAKVLGLTIPQTLLLRADQLIE
jgi:putative ABC transport system substrate-binding protein